MPQQQRLAQKLITLEFKAQELLHGLLRLLPYHTIGLFVTKMTPKAVQEYNDLDNILYDEASEILARLIALRKKYNVSLSGIYNYSFDRLSEPHLVYTTSNDGSDFYIPIEALYNPDVYFDKKEAEFIHNAEMDRKTRSIYDDSRK